MEIDLAPQEKRDDKLVFNPKFWTIAVIFTLITIHHYEDVTNITLFFMPDKFVGLTRHTVDRIFYLLPIFFSSIVFGSRGGFISLVVSLLAMLPRAIFISESPSNALLESFVIVMIGSLVPIRIDYYHRQNEKLDLVMERLETTQRRLYSKVRMTMEQGKQLAVINSLSAMLSQAADVSQVVQNAITMVMEVIQAEVVLIFSLDRSTQELRIVACEGISDKSALAIDRMKIGEGLCGHVADVGEPVIVEDASADSKYCSATVNEENIKTQLSVPLVARGKIVGTLCVATRARRQFKEPEVQLLSALGNLIGIAMDNSQLFLERELATDLLSTSEKKYRQLFENAHDPIWVQDLFGTITAANEATGDLFGCKVSDLIGINIKQLLSQESFELSKNIQEKILNGQNLYQPYTQRLIKKDGSETILMITANLISDNGYPKGLQFIGRDTTNEIRMQENQRFYLQQITRAHEDERQRISRDLHDSTAQDLIAALRQMEIICRKQNMPDESIQGLWDIYGQLKNSLQDIRQLSRDLRPSIIDDLGLLPAVEWLVEQIRNDYSIDAQLIIIGEERRFAPEIEVTLFRIAQEALRNIAKHAGATEAQVIIELKEKETRIRIADNGKGFELPKSLGDFSRVGKLGIDGMQTRGRLTGGTFNINSELGKGTTIDVTIPA